MTKISFILLSILIAKISFCQSTFKGTYDITRSTEIKRGTNESPNVIQTSYTGFLIKKGNKSISYQTPNSLDTSIKKLDPAHIYFDISGGERIQLFTYINLDSSLQKIYSNSKNYCRYFSLDEDKWQLTKETKTIGDFKCTKALLSDPSNVKDIYMEAWITTDIPNKNGLDITGVKNVPGVIIWAKIFPTNDIYVLKSYEIDKEIKEADFQRKEILAPCVQTNNISEDQLKKNKKRLDILNQ